MPIRFGEYILDSETRDLLRHGERVHVSPKAFRLLEVLVANSPKALSKEELQEQLWPATFVSESSLAGLIGEIRKTLGDDADEPKFIRTVYGFGYAFAGGMVEETAIHVARSSDRAFRLVWGRREIDLRDGENILGRARDAIVWIDSSQVSRHHARIMIGPDGATLEDLGSKNGTFVGRERLVKPRRLADGDAISIGHVSMIFRTLDDSGSTESALP
jgi:DNA-binding winged helix-turn-helix (wHTH) protein